MLIVYLQQNQQIEALQPVLAGDYSGGWRKHKNPDAKRLKKEVEERDDFRTFIESVIDPAAISKDMRQSLNAVAEDEDEDETLLMLI